MYGKCCKWNSKLDKGIHCDNCCTLLEDWRSRDRHFALNHRNEVVTSTNAWLQLKERKR